MPARKTALELVRSHVNEWDPIGLVSMGSPLDEYDCISMHLIGMLSRNARDSEIHRWLEAEIPEHFGVARAKDTDRDRLFLAKLRVAWQAANIRSTSSRSKDGKG